MPTVDTACLSRRRSSCITVTVFCIRLSACDLPLHLSASASSPTSSIFLSLPLTARSYNNTSPYRKTLGQRIVENMSSDLYRLNATEILTKIRAGDISVEDYARSLLARIGARDEAVQAWAYLKPDYVIKQAKALDAVPPAERGPLHGVAIAVKDVLYTKGTPNRVKTSGLHLLTNDQICPPSSTLPSTQTTHPK
jgi:hypothetical protein